MRKIKIHFSQSRLVLVTAIVFLISFSVQAQITTGEVSIEELANVTQIDDNTTINGDLTVTQNVAVSGEVQAINTYKLSTVNKWYVPTNSTTNICQSSEIGVGSGGMLKVTLEMKGDPGHDQNCEGIWYVPYRRGNAWGGLNTGVTKVSEIHNTVSVNLNSTVSGNTIILSVTLSNYNPNHNVNTVSLKIEHMDRNLSWTAL